ncbi:transporter substrate-binding domain-containing protein [bacterium]|jgi:signal transduction histidine kinase|nr:transporter substrate-binding domain-containing protein [bacterium]
MKYIFIITFLLSSLYANQTNFKISYDPNYAPFSYNQEEKPAGLFIDIWKLWAKYNNYTIEFVDGVLWDDAVNLVKKKEVNFFLGSKKYEPWMFESNSFYEIKSSFFKLLQNDISIETKKELTIGIIGNVYEKILLEKFPNANIKIYEDYIYSIDALRNNQIDLIYDDKIPIDFYTVQHNFFHLIKPLSNFILKNSIHAIAYDEKNTKIFNDGFINIPINELLELEKKWIINNNEYYYLNFKQQLNLTNEEITFLKNHTINTSVSNSWAPFAFKSNNEEAQGISSEYWELILKKINAKNKNTFFNTFSDQLEGIKNKQNDLIFSVGETPQRKEYALFSKEYIRFPISIVTKKDENFIENFSSIIGKKIAIGNNFTAHNILKNIYPNLEFILVDSVKKGLDLVSKNKAYAYIDIKPVLFYNIAKYEYTNLKISGNTGVDFSLRFMIRDDYPILESILNKAISSISLNELNTIITKWNNIQFQTNFNYDLFWKSAIVILLILLAFIHRTRTLKKLNSKLKITVEEKTQKLNEINKNLESLVEKKSQELLQKENILNHQSKMAAMGEMIENIAHQWRQPLSVISTVATGAKLKKELGLLNDDDFYETMNIINNSSQHLSNTIDDFRNFFSNDKEVALFDIDIPIEKVLYLISTKLKNRNITVVKNCKETFVTGLENEFIQVILNIINNAMDAFENKNNNSKFIFIDAYKENKSIIIKIKDNAGGIERNIIDRVFEPYFTTKHKSQGTGIGLYMSLEIIKKHMNGNLTVNNEKFTYKDIKCTGAQFTIELPINNQTT